MAAFWVEPMATSTVENYLKHILLLSDDTAGLVPMGALAASLEVVPGTVTTMVRALAGEGLVEHQPRVGVRLTGEGRHLALSVLRKHRLVETFLVNVLKMDWSAVHAEAEQLEHAISDDVLDRLDALLGHPATDPHGDPIPSRQGKLATQVYATLATCVLAKPVRVVRVTEQSAEFLQFVEKHGLLPGAVVRVAERNLSAGLVTLKKAGGRALALSLAAAGKILAEPIRKGVSRRGEGNEG
jgi:DtxR family Mn-dependent transcriptional regulator